MCWFRYGMLRVNILLSFYSVWPLLNLIIVINVSRLLYRALQTYKYFTTIHLITEKFRPTNVIRVCNKGKALV